jgi:asparagine synthetase B (glutamine-hydrolysing)
MTGVFIAVGAVARPFTRTDWRGFGEVLTPDVRQVSVKEDDLVLMLWAPSSGDASPTVVWTDDGNLGLAIDGYLITESLNAQPSLAGHLRVLAEAIRRHGTVRGLQAVVAGAFNLLVIDRERGSVSVVNDRMGAIPLYYARTNEGCLFSTNPVLLVSTGLIPKDVDYTACAEWAYFGYTIGERHFLKAIKVFPRASVLQWDRKAHTATWEHAGVDPLSIPPTADRADVGEVAERFSAACHRLHALGGRTAHLQSAGMDSRLILAAWPAEQALPCYTYGSLASTEVAIAETIAQIRGSSFTHVRPSGEQVADTLDAMFAANGLLVYPDRFLSARSIRGQGSDRVLDGFLGDVFLGGSFYSSDRFFSLLSRCGRYLTLFKDQKVSAIGLDRIAEVLVDEISEVRDEASLAKYLTDDAVARLKAEQPTIAQDIYQELKSLSPADDSLAILFRNFKVANRCLHAIAQQGVMSRQFLQVYYPFTNDVPFLDYLLTLRPHVTAYRKLYLNLFRRRYRAYAEALYGGSLLPLRRSALAHKWSAISMSSKVSLPLITGKLPGHSLNWNNWQLWLRESRPLRDKVSQWLCDTGIGEKERVAATMSQVASGDTQGSGKVFHLAAIGKWLSLAHS